MTDPTAETSTHPTTPHAYPAWFEHFPFAPWGFRELNLYGWPLLGLTIVVGLWGSDWAWLAVIPGLLFAQLLYFFRDPTRTIPADPAAIVSPADGKVVDVTPVDHDDFFDGPVVRIGIFLSIFNVHINRAPAAGRVLATRYKPGEFLNALNPESALRNEFMWIGFETTEGPPRRFAVRQISGLIARRIVCLLWPKDVVQRGAKFGMIKLGSRTELTLPRDAVTVTTTVGAKVKAGADTLAKWNP